MLNETFSVIFKHRDTVGLLLVLPFLSHFCKIHDAFIQTIVMTLETIGCFLFAFSSQLWQIYASTGVIELMGYCKYGLVRTIMSKSVEADETGKMYSALAIFAAAMPLAGNPAFRQLYDTTLDTFPAAEILLAASILFISAILNFVIYHQRWRINEREDKNNEKSINKMDAEFPASEYSLSHM